MKAVVVYESVFGNTQSVAEAISKGLGEQYEVSVFEVSEADYSVLDSVDLLIVGGPTHVWSMSRPLTRKVAVEDLKKVMPDRKPVSEGIGVREWLNKLPHTRAVAAAAFDTRMPRKSIIPVSFASGRMASRLRKHGYRIVVKPEGFVVVDAKGPLAEGELKRAAEWGRTIAVASHGHSLSEAMIDQTLADSFPASDPPAWTLGRDHQQEVVMGGRKSDKQYTNEAWTKRVDHEAGRHRTQRAPAEPLVCEVCGDVYTNRRWVTSSAFKVRQKPTSTDFSTRQWVAAEKPKGPENSPLHAAQTVVCPACQRQREGVPSGFLHLEGEFLAHHREEIERLLSNEADRAAEDNPLARLMKRDHDEKGRLMLATTTEHLAQRLGRSLHKAFKGKVRYDFSHENKLAHVYWSRN